MVGSSVGVLVGADVEVAGAFVALAEVVAAWVGATVGATAMRVGSMVGCGALHALASTVNVPSIASKTNFFNAVTSRSNNLRWASIA